MKKKLVSVLAAALWAGSVFSTAVFAAEYKIDADHSTVGFKVKHLFSKVQGQFKKFEGTFSYDPADLTQWKAEATIDAASIDTNVEKRDNHLRSKDFFEVEKYPTITFKSTGAHDLSGDKAKVDGLLTIHGVEKPVTLDVEIHGEGADPWGNTRLGMTATTTINRKDFGLAWNQLLESGKVLVGEEVEIVLELEGLKQAAPAAAKQ